MSRLPRWAEEGATAEELRLLQASRRERPDPEARLRTLLALGVAGPSNGSPPSGGAQSPWRPWYSGTTAKIAILVVCGGAIGGAAWFASSRRAPVAAAAATAPPPLIPPIPAPPATGPVVPATVEAAIEATSIAPPAAGETGGRDRPPHTTSKRSLRPAAAGPAARLAERSDPAKLPVAESTLSAEVAALERAHAALAAHDAAGALQALDQYEAAFPSGRLASEEIVLRVQALLARGDEDAASALAERFFAGHPDSSYVSRLRDLLHDAEERQNKN